MNRKTLTYHIYKILPSRASQIAIDSVNGFHHPKIIHYQHGKHSPEGLYHNSFDYPSLTENLFSPLVPGGNRRYKLATSITI